MEIHQSHLRSIHLNLNAEDVATLNRREPRQEILLLFGTTVHQLIIDNRPSAHQPYHLLKAQAEHQIDVNNASVLKLHNRL